jgi:ribosomal small subunit protein bTHX
MGLIDGRGQGMTRARRRETTHTEDSMGKGDQRSRRGKIYRGSHGKTRPHGNKKRDHAAEAKSTR